jgi:hypothetical protein
MCIKVLKPKTTARELLSGPKIPEIADDEVEALLFLGGQERPLLFGPGDHRRRQIDAEYGAAGVGHGEGEAASAAGQLQDGARRFGGDPGVVREVAADVDVFGVVPGAVAVVIDVEAFDHLPSRWARRRNRRAFNLMKPSASACW